MSSIADDPAAELRELRRRAYGPGADIHEDAAAMARLHELENGVRSAPREPAAPEPLLEEPLEPAATPLPDATDASPRTAEDASGEGIPSPAGDAEEVDAAPPATPARTPWWRRRTKLLWAASLVVAALLGSAVTLSAQAVAAGQVAVLAEVSADDADWPEDFWSPAPPGARIFEEFYGFSVVAVPEDFGYGPTTCIYLVSTSAAYFGASGCSAGAFPATASTVVGPQAPRELSDRFGYSTALRFVLDGDQVRVYAAQPAPGETP